MEFNKLILKWYDKNKRELPWRNTKDPYNIWISEIILQQTRIEQGVYYYNRFISKFPNLDKLANSEEKDVLLIWQGLGYYSRARNLHYTAKYIYNVLNSIFPENYADLIKLKGVGDYTSSAISSICFEKKYPVLDGNVFRVLSRVFEIKSPIDLNKSRKVFKQKANEIMPNARFGDYNQGLMDFGSIICKPVNPDCINCVLSKICSAFKNNSVTDFPVKVAKNKIKSRYFDYLIIKNNDQVLIEQIKDGIWKNMYQFPVYNSKSKKSKKEIIKFFSKKFRVEKLNIEQINNKLIRHKLSHITINSRFWRLKSKINTDNELFISSFNDYPISKLMQKFIEKYKDKLSLI